MQPDVMNQAVFDDETKDKLLKASARTIVKYMEQFNKRGFADDLSSESPKKKAATNSTLTRP